MNRIILLLIDPMIRFRLRLYARMFKTREFCLESTHFKDAERLSKLVALMSLALCWAVKTEEWLHQLNPIKIKKHGRQAKSIFRYSLDYLR